MEKSTVSGKLLEAIRCFLKGEKVLWDQGMDAARWEELFRLARYHQILPMIYEAVYQCPAFAACPPQTAKAYKAQVIRQVMVQSRKTEEFLQLYRRLLDRGLTPLVVKGIVCRNLYREPDYRASGDEDVLIPAEQFRDCGRVFEENGLMPAEPQKDPEGEGEVSYFRPGGALHIELHKELFPSESQAYGKLNDYFKDVFQRKIREEIHGVGIYTMCHTDHLLYLILHAFKHFLHSGFGVRQVCDIVIFADTYGKEIDWEYVLEKCREIRGDVFAASLFDIGRRYFDFDPVRACFPKSWSSLAADGEDLLEDLLEGGVFGDSSLSRKHSSNITLQAVSESRKGKKAGASIAWSLFPDRRYMERKYTYLKQYPFLLPAAWILRLGSYVKEIRKTGGNNARESMEIGSRRVNLMKKYKIIQ